MTLPAGFDPDETHIRYYRRADGALVMLGGSTPPELPEGATELDQDAYLTALTAREDDNDQHVRDIMVAEAVDKAADHAELIALGVSGGAAARMSGHRPGQFTDAKEWTNDRRVTRPGG